MNLWDHLLRLLGYRRVRRVTFQAEEELLDTLSSMAEHDHMPANQVAADLLVQAMSRRRNTEVYLHYWEMLTPREQQVAALVCLNYTNRQAAARLGISDETIKSHMHNVLAKFNMRSRSDLRQALSDWDFSAWDQ